MIKKATVLLSAGLLAAGACSGSLFAQTLNLDYSTYLGGGGNDAGYGISAGTDGAAYVTGYTQSFNFPAKSPRVLPRRLPA